MLKTYYSLTKPGIIYGNILTTIGGFLFATHSHIHLSLFIAVVVGTSLVIAGACVINNYIDRRIDQLMARTERRALVTGKVNSRQAIIYAGLLAISGFYVLVVFINLLTFGIGVAAFIDYVIFYGLAKRHSVHGTVVGSISGAAPIVAGYTAVTNRLDAGALLLFLLLVCWQMPHFYAIAIYRLQDYKAAGLPVLPIVKGLFATKVQILLYAVAFITVVVCLTMFGYTGYTFLIVMLGVSIWWLIIALKGFKISDSKKWARTMFGYSLIVISALSIMLAVGSRLP